MKKIIGLSGILLVLLIPVIANPILAVNLEEYNADDLELRWKLLIAIGRVNISFDDKILYGFVLVGYTNGETLIFESINIPFDGIPLFINNGLFFSFLLYKPATNL